MFNTPVSSHVLSSKQNKLQKYSMETLNFNKYNLQKYIFIILIGGILFFLSFFSLNSKSLVTSRIFQSPSPDERLKLETRKDELEEVLERTSMSNKTVIIAVVNKAYVEGKVHNMLDLFLEGFWGGEGTRELVNHLMIVAVDQTAYERCLFRGLHCYRLVTEGVDFMQEKVFMSEDFLKMMWSRTLFLQQVLKRGYNFIFTDTDVLWLRNPFTILTSNSTRDLDIQFSIDNFNGDSTSILNPINTGFYFVKSNNKTISLFEKWYNMKDDQNSTGKKEQDVLQNLIYQGEITNLQLKVRFLDTLIFSGFCQESPNIRTVVTIHANCCRYIKAKVADLSRVLRQWAWLKGTHVHVKTHFQWSRHVECDKSWQTSDGNG